MSQTHDTTSSYDELVTRLRGIYDVQQMNQLLDWDRLVTMSDEGAAVRGKQKSTANSVLKEKLTDDRMGELFEEIDTEQLDDEQSAVVREAKRRYEKNVNSPTQIEAPLRQRLNKAGPFWQKAVKTGDFGEYVPLLDEILQLQRKRASHLDPERDPSAVLFENKHTHIDIDTADRVFDTLLEELVPLRDELAASSTEMESSFAGTTAFPVEKQEELNRKVLDVLGFDWSRGRLDTAPHAFSCGNPYDVRIATPYDEADPTDALLTALHEFGHAIYTLGLPEDHYGTPLGTAMGGIVHESQSFFWENHIGRSRAFWEFVLPELTDVFPELADVSVEEAYETVNRAYDDGLLYVEGKEVTLHINNVVRHRMERKCYELDDLGEVADVVGEEMDERLGVQPDTPKKFQNAPWPKGFFGFEAYTLGAVLAAQLNAAASSDIEDFDGKIRRGEFGDLQNWLTENVYSHGQRYSVPELVERATGEELTADYYVDYVREKYGSLYDI